MVERKSSWKKVLPLLLVLLGAGQLSARCPLPEQDAAGSIRGLIRDADFDAVLPGAQVTLVETGVVVTTSDQGNYVITDVPPGTYTVVISKAGYVRQVKANVVVQSGQLTDVDASLAGEFTEMDEFLVQDLLAGGASTEAALLELRIDSPALMDSIGSDLMSRAGASDAAAALTLVSGATVQDGKFAVIRGLPDRYVSNQMNGVILPSADEDKRAVELDQFPAAVIESIQVSKTFTPDQQGDASGGAVNLQLKGIPTESFFEVKTQGGYSSQINNQDDFLSFNDGPLRQQKNHLGENWKGQVGVSEKDAPAYDNKWSVAGGTRVELENEITIGGFATLYYEKDSSYIGDGIDNSWWVVNPGDKLTPQTSQGSPSDGDFKTSLFDVKQSSETEQWGGLVNFGIESERHKLGVTYLQTKVEENVATLAEDTNGKDYYFPGYDPNDPTGPGNTPDTVSSAPYLRTQTLEYSKRTTSTLQFRGEHILDMGGYTVGPLEFTDPVLDWSYATSTAKLDQPDKRQFGSLWQAPSFNPGFPPFFPPFTSPATYFPYKPAANFNLGNLQRIFKTIKEDSDQYAIDLKLPFLYEEREGYVKVGVFSDHVERHFNQDTYSNFGDAGASYQGGWDDYWSTVFPSEDHPISGSDFDVDYDGELNVDAWYGMMDFPISENVDLLGGVRFESTDISITNHPEENATWFPPDATSPVKLGPGDADVSYDQDDVLPAVGIEYRPTEEVTLRASYSQTVARQTFKELSPILQQEFLGGPIFIGNPDLQMASLQNFDLRADYRPQPSTLFSVSLFHKDIDDPIEYVQRVVDFTYTTPVNYPEGEMNGIELEARQGLGAYWEDLEGLAVGANATFINSEVQLSKKDRNSFQDPAIDVNIKSRDMTGAPEYLYNLNATYDLRQYGTQMGLFYTIKGDTLVAGAGQANGNFVPDLYEKEFGTLNASISQELSERSKLTFKVKNITNPSIKTAYQGKGVDGEKTHTSYKRGREYTLGLTVRF